MWWLNFIYVLISLIAVAQTPLLVDLLRALFPTWKISRLTSHLTHYSLMTLMTSFFCTALIYFFVFLPLIAPLTSPRGVCLLLFGLWLWINMVVNYYLSVFVQPGVDGTVPLQTKTESSHNGTGGMFKKLDSSHEIVCRGPCL